MAYNKANLTNIDKSDLADYPFGQIKDNDGTNDGTPVSRLVYSDIHENFGKLLRLAGLVYNNQYDNESNGFQYVQALQALAGKNDLVQPVTTGTATIGGTTTNILILAGVKIETLLTGEILIGQASADYAAQTYIQGSTTGTYKTLSSTPYKANDYLFIVNGTGGISIQSIATTSSLDFLVNALLYLKAATTAQSVAASPVNTVAITPFSFLFAFTKFVTDPTASIPFLATDTTPGLLSASDKNSIDHSLNTKNVGWVSGIEPGGGGVGSTLPTGGDIANCTVLYVGTMSSSQQAYTNYTINFNNAMSNTNYFVRMSIVSQGSFYLDNAMRVPVIKAISTTQFQMSISEAQPGTESLKIYFEVVQSAT